MYTTPFKHMLYTLFNLHHTCYIKVKAHSKSKLVSNYLILRHVTNLFYLILVPNDPFIILNMEVKMTVSLLIL